VVLLTSGALVLAPGGCAGREETVAVPGVRSASVEFAYRRLHDAGLRVAIPASLDLSSQRSVMVRDQSPRAGAAVARGSVVTLTTAGGVIGSIAVPRRQPRASVPSFVGADPDAVVRWAERNRLLWRVALPPLRAGHADSLLANYRVLRQTPAPGAHLRLGVQLAHGFRPTPISVVARSD
jgi:hypothetical protein